MFSLPWNRQGKAHTTWEYGIETPWGISWDAWVGHDGYRIKYTKDNIAHLASGRKIYRRKKTTYLTEYGPPEDITEMES